MAKAGLAVRITTEVGLSQVARTTAAREDIGQVAGTDLGRTAGQAARREAAVSWVAVTIHTAIRASRIAVEEASAAGS